MVVQGRFLDADTTVEFEAMFADEPAVRNRTATLILAVEHYVAEHSRTLAADTVTRPRMICRSVGGSPTSRAPGPTAEAAAPRRRA
jgi:hypothetical protein